MSLSIRRITPRISGALRQALGLAGRYSHGRACEVVDPFPPFLRKAKARLRPADETRDGEHDPRPHQFAVGFLVGGVHAVTPRGEAMPKQGDGGRGQFDGFRGGSLLAGYC
jgi:hypothetical protein